MTIRPIRELGDPVLRTPSDPVRAFDAWLAALVRDLEETVEHPGRAGVAAPQIGVNVRAFSYNVDGVIGHMVNPVIVERSEEVQDGDEGCLSVPGIWAPTVRAMRCVGPPKADVSSLVRLIRRMSTEAGGGQLGKVRKLTRGPPLHGPGRRRR